MADTIAVLLDALRSGGAPAKRAVKKLKTTRLPGAATALVAELSAARIKAISGSIFDRQADDVREYVRLVLDALSPHRDDAAVVSRVSEVYRKCAGDGETYFLAHALLTASKAPEAREALLAGLLGPVGVRQQAGADQWRDLPLEQALAWLDKLCAPTRLGSKDGQRAARELFDRVVGPRGRLSDLGELERHPRFLDVCAGLLGGPLHRDAVDGLAQAHDRRALPGLIARINDFGAGSLIAQRMYALESLASMADPAAMAAIEQHVQRSGLHKAELNAAKKALATLRRGGKAKPAKKSAVKMRVVNPARFKVSAEPAKKPGPAQLARVDGSYTLSFDAFERAFAVFAKEGKDGGGHGWAGVLDWLLRAYSPQTLEQVELDPEASLFVAVSERRRPLLVVAALLQQALDDPKLLRAAIRQADPELMG